MKTYIIIAENYPMAQRHFRSILPSTLNPRDKSVIVLTHEADKRKLFGRHFTDGSDVEIHRVGNEPFDVRRDLAPLFPDGIPEFTDW